MSEKPKMTVNTITMPPEFCFAKCTHCRAPTQVQPTQTVARCRQCGARFELRKAGAKL